MQTTFLAIFFTGLLTGGLTCMAVQGGLLAAMIAQREEEKKLDSDKTKKGAALPIGSFLAAKLFAYTVLGFLLGSVGSVVGLSPTARVVMQFLVIIFMVGTGLALLNVHPIFRYFIIQPPKFLTRMVRAKSKSRDTFAPAILGAFTIFIPCGTTQAMMALAIASASAMRGAGIMFAFVLGTTPIFFILGYFATRLGDLWQKKFFKVAAVAIILLAVFNLNNAIALTGSPWTFDSALKSAWCGIAYCGEVSSTKQETAVIDNSPTIVINSVGYSPNVINVKAGALVNISLVNKDGSSCVQAFTIPKLGLQKVVPVGSSATLTFTAPSQPGQLAFMCSMGMYRGIINVN